MENFSSIVLSKVQHKDEDRILITFPFDQKIVDRIKSIRGSKWSKSYKGWHVPYSKSNYHSLIKLFPGCVVKAKGTNVSVIDSSKQLEKPESQQLLNHEMVMCEITDKKIILVLRKNEVDIQFIKGIKFSRWNSGRYWTIPNYGKNEELIKEYFRDRLVIKRKISGAPINKVFNETGKAVIIKTRGNSLRIFVEYNKGIVAKIKSYPIYSFNREENYWSLPNTEFILSDLIDFLKGDGLAVEVKEEEVIGISGNDNLIKAPGAFVEKLKDIHGFCKLFFH